MTSGYVHTSMNRIFGDGEGGEILSKFEKVGEMEWRGKVLSIKMGDPEDPVECFCFLEDVEKLLHGQFQYVKIYRGEESS